MKLLLRTAMLLGICVFLGGCAPREKSIREELTVKVYDPASGYVGEQGGWYGALLKEKFNLTLNFLDPAQEGALEEADLIIGGETGLTFGGESAAGSWEADLVPAGDEEGVASPGEEDLAQAGDAESAAGPRETDLQEWAASGKLLDLESYLEGTELWEYEPSLRYWNEKIAEEGIFAVPAGMSRLDALTPSEEVAPRYGIYIRWEDYAAAGHPRIWNRQELLEVLADLTERAQAREAEQKRLQENESEWLREEASEQTRESSGKQSAPQEIPEVWGVSLYRTDGEGEDLLTQIFRMVGAYGYKDMGFGLYRQNRFQDTDVLEEDGPVAQAVRWLWEANQAGLLDPDSSVQSRQQLLEKYEKGLVLIHAEPELNLEGYMLAPVEDMEPVSFGCNPKGTLEQFAAVSVRTKEPERMIDLLLWLYSAEGIMDGGTHMASPTAGPMGITWEIENGEPTLTPFGEKVLYGEDETYPVEGQGTWQEGYSRLSLQPVVPVEVTPSGMLYRYRLWDSVRTGEGALWEDWSAYMEADDALEYLMENNSLSVLAAYEEPAGEAYEDSPELGALRAKCRAQIVEALWQIIYAEEEEQFESLWEKMREDALKFGYEEILETDLERIELFRVQREEAAR